MTLKQRLLLITIPINVIVIVCIYFLVKVIVFNTILKIENENANSHLSTAILSIENQYQSLNYLEEYSYNLRKKESEDIIAIARTLIQELYTDYKSGTISKSAAQQIALKRIEKLRYDNGKGYVWINNTEKPLPRMLMHPIYPKLNNTILSDTTYNTSPGSRNIFSVAVEKCETNGNGYIEYLWSKPSQKEGVHKKISYVELFEPWQWIMGTGIYFDDIKTDAQMRLSAIIEELKQTLGQSQIVNKGYFYIFNSNKEMLLHPSLNGINRDSVSKSLTAELPLEEIISSTKKNQKTYQYTRTESGQRKDDNNHQEIVFFDYYEPLDWYVCTSYNQDNIELPRQALNSRLLLIAAIFLLLSTIVSISLSNNISSSLSKLMAVVSKFSISKTNIALSQIPSSGLKETRALSKVIKEMLMAINEQKKDLVKAIATADDLNKMLLNVIDTIPVRVFWKDKQSNYLGANKLFAQDAGINSPEELIGKSDYDYFDREVAEQYRTDDKTVITTEVSKINYEELQTNELRNNCWLNTSKVPLRNHKGEIYGVLGTYEDITEKKEREFELKKTQLLLLEAQEIAHIGSWQWYIDSGKMEWSKELYDIYGYTPEKTPPNFDQWISCFHDEDRQIALDLFKTSIKKGDSFNFSHRIIQKGTQKVKWLYVRGKLEYDKHSNKYLFGTAQDITDLKEIQIELERHKDNLEILVKEKTEDLETANEELKSINEELYDKNEIIKVRNTELSSALKHLKETQSQLLQTEKMASLGILTAGVAHEINNPLNYIMGAYVALDDYFKMYGSKDANNTEILLNSIKLGIDKAANIVKGLSQFSRDSKNLHEDCNLHSIIDDCLVMLFNQYKHKAEIIKKLHKDLIIIKGNVGKLHQVFLNIFSNAVQSIEKNGSITVTTKIEGDNVIIIVADTGCGIPKENLKKIADPFFTTKNPGEGTGLGLSISYSIIKEHKGNIDFESELTKGTSVTIMLPIKIQNNE